MLRATELNQRLYCNGAEQLKEGEWTLYSNFSDIHEQSVSIGLQISGLLCYVDRNAFNKQGQLLQDTFSVYIPASISQKSKSLCFIDVYRKTKNKTKIPSLQL